MPMTPETFRQHALEVLDFWRRHAVDGQFGGFIPQLDREGRIYDDSQKHLVAAARLLYTFSQGMLLEGPPWCEEMARRAAKFLLQHFWDAQHGGWYWSCRRDGTPAEKAKRTYGHDFAILALAEFHRATGFARSSSPSPLKGEGGVRVAALPAPCQPRPSPSPLPGGERDSGFARSSSSAGDAQALAMAERTFDVLEQHLWDPHLGGYREGCDRSWTIIDPPWLGQNCQMHALEAILALNELTGKPRCRERIADLCRLMDAHLFDRQHGCIPEEFHEDWTIDRTRRGDRISIGHQFEWAWLLMRAEGVAAGAVNTDRIDQLMDFAVRHGWDDQFGGVYTNVSSTGEVLNDRKGFWENCEAVLALLWYARRTGEKRYRDVFERCAAFSFAHLADREHGGWFGAVTRDGTPVATNKGGPWKTDYHVVQMCAEVHRFLRPSPQGA